MDAPTLSLLEDTVTILRDDGRASSQVWTFTKRVADWSRGTIPQDQRQALHQEVYAYAKQTKTGPDVDHRVATLLCKGLNGDERGMVQDLAGLLLEGYRVARGGSAETR